MELFSTLLLFFIFVGCTCHGIDGMETAPIERLPITNMTTAALFHNWNTFINEHQGLKSLRKTVYSTEKRLVFVAGLEGTGHHTLKTAFAPCFSFGVCQPINNLTNAFFRLNVSRAQLHGLFSTFDMDKTEHFLQEALHALHAFITAPSPTTATATAPTVAIIGLESTYSAGMMSYPNYGLPEKVFHHPDLFIIALLAESMGVDFRIIVLQRNAQAILHSTQRRGFGGKLEARILIENAGSMYAELDALDPQFYRCVHHEQLSQLNHTQQDVLTDFILPALSPHMSTMLNKAVANKREVSSHPRGYFAANLEMRLGQVNKLCATRRV